MKFRLVEDLEFKLGEYRMSLEEEAELRESSFAHSSTSLDNVMDVYDVFNGTLKTLINALDNPRYKDFVPCVDEFKTKLNNDYSRMMNKLEKLK